MSATREARRPREPVQRFTYFLQKIYRNSNNLLHVRVC
ncbi:uncharacterized protein CLUP02_08968 [Colletotrichum lupini]|uniref:Uncharacterized protein n=1 Tax=Colletotrichum lupini TaxID=145971 RepID=A0A9Q8SU25_9PEZI|nr:uncharacterized protein CLUP02_08968 [Colletotrichum lupini]UQC83473.1 hypothetical protein CLUP02_08968 [Colletotrichum lupini]